jgi:L-ribulose-5-phosphate 4-epimerase
MLESLKQAVYEANLDLVTHGLVIFTWGNVSAIDRERNLVVIKPSGVSYEKMQPEDMVVLDLNGNIVEGLLQPSSDTPTHLVLYKHYKDIGAVVHTHSEWATSWAQAGRSIPPLGTTHADYFFGKIPCTRKMAIKEIKGEYEKETGNLIVETIASKNAMDIPAILVNGHGPFAWGTDAKNAVHNAVVLEYVAKIAHHTVVLKDVNPIEQELLDKHFLRKHGKNAYYGQKPVVEEISKIKKG